MSTRVRGRGRGGHGMTTHGATTRSSTPSNDQEQNSSPAPHVSESAQPNLSLTANATVTKNGRGKTKGLALAKIRGRGEKVKLGFSRALGQPTSENDDDLTRYTTEIGVIVRQFAPLQAKSWEKVPQDAKDICVAHIREKFELPEATYVDTAMLRTMGRRYCDMRTRLKKKFTEGEVDCPADIEEADWIYLCNLWQDEDYKLKCGKYKVSRSKPRIHHAAGSRAFYKVKNDMDKLKQVKDQSMENGSTPLSDEELSRTVLGHKSGYLRGLGDGPKPSSTKSGQISRAQLIRDAEEARQEAAALKRSCEEAQMIAAEARKNSEQLAETVANMQSTLNFLLQQQNGRNVPSNDAIVVLVLWPTIG
ncbi:hypothetical protein Vadar_006794 [Vaccinium darrowii]|uniref:Uncharacterized protein n=1 Tax=Vaccinium darrowii TaxID=229202 RepID=A0ACB7YCL9_9ERIC|nr:hypothetical protein Vadar_006794 [Vaccinium darrowii]